MTAPRRPRLVTVAVLAATLVALLAASWERWGRPTTDCGGSVDLAARVAMGEVLYRDVLSIYGPLSTWIVAGAMRLFGLHLDVVYAVGIGLLLVASTCWWAIVRRFCSELETAVGLAGFWALLALQPDLFNWILPNTFANSVGTTCALATVALLATDLDRPSDTRIVMASLGAAAAGLAKIECGAAAVGVLVGWTLLAPAPNRGRVRGLALATLPGALLTAATAAVLLYTVPWRSLIFDNLYRIRSLEQTVDVYREFMTAPAMRAPAATVAWELGAIALLVLAATLGMAQWRGSWARRTLGVGLAGGAGAALWASTFGPWEAPWSAWVALTRKFDWTGIGWLAVGAVTVVAHRGRLREPAHGGLVLAAFVSVLLAARWELWPVWAPFSAPLAPALILVLVRAGARRIDVQRAGVGAALACAVLVAFGARQGWRTNYRFKVGVIETTRGTIRTRPLLAKVFRDVIEHVQTTTAPDAYVAVVPEERFINFFTARRHPTRDPGTGPGWLATRADEQRFVREVLDERTALLVVSNRPYLEFRHPRFAKYQPRVMARLEEHFAFERAIGRFRIYRRRGHRANG